MNLTFLSKKIKIKLLGTIVVSSILMLFMYLVGDEQLNYIVYGSIIYSAFYSLIWVIPISLIILFIETKIDLIPKVKNYKKYITWVFIWAPKYAKYALKGALLLILSTLWILITYGSLIILGIQKGG